jgi:hypothetical protein
MSGRRGGGHKRRWLEGDYMRSIVCKCALLASTVVVLNAQEFPKADVFLGYSFLRYNSAQTIPAFTANGGIGTFGWNFTDQIGLEAELGGYHNGNVNNYQFDTTTFSYLFGPRISWSRSKKIDPYGHVLFGGQHGTTSIAADSVLVVNPHAVASGPSSDGRYKTSQNTFSLAVGGGLDIRLTHRWIIRPLQVDYYVTRYAAPDVVLPSGSLGSIPRNQNNFRYAAGVAYNFGTESPKP